LKRWLALVITAIAILAGIFSFYQSASINSRSGGDAPVYSSRRHDPYGTAALFELLSERGISVRNLETASLDADDRGTLIQVLPLETSSRQARYHLQTQQLADWISQGNTVVQFTRVPTELMTRFKISPTTKPSNTSFRDIQDFESRGDAPNESPAEKLLASVQDWPAFADARLLLWSPMTFPDDAQPGGWKPIAKLPTQHNAVVAGEFKIGAGRLVVIGSPTPALNGMLNEAANLDFILSLVGDGPVILDEWSHGVGHEATIVGFLHDVGLLPVLLQLAVLALLYVWSTSGIRRTEDLIPPRQRSSIEQIETLGFLYSRSLSTEVKFNRVNAEVARRLAEAMHCPAREVKKRISQLPDGLRTRLDQLFNKLVAAQPAHAPRCINCGYDLTKNETGRCPECGADISLEIRRRIAESNSEDLLTSGSSGGESRARGRADLALADILTLAYQLSREVQRVRRLER